MPAREGAIDFAFCQASLHRQPLTAVHVADGARLGLLDAEVETSLRLLSEALAGMSERYPDVQITPACTAGPRLSALVAEGRDKQMIVLGEHVST